MKCTHCNEDLARNATICYKCGCRQSLRASRVFLLLFIFVLCFAAIVGISFMTA